MVQVDIAPTLALLFGVPIPKNNVGVLIPGTLTSLTGHFAFFPLIFLSLMHSLIRKEENGKKWKMME